MLDQLVAFCGETISESDVQKFLVLQVLKQCKPWRINYTERATVEALSSIMSNQSRQRAKPAPHRSNLSL